MLLTVLKLFLTDVKSKAIIKYTYTFEVWEAPYLKSLELINQLNTISLNKKLKTNYVCTAEYNNKIICCSAHNQLQYTVQRIYESNINASEIILTLPIMYVHD